MRNRNYFQWSTFYQFTACVTLMCLGPVHAQPTVLLEACNAIDDKDRRLTCFKELSTLKSAAAPESVAAAHKIKNAFAAVAGAVGSGISLNNYSTLLLEPSKELEIFRQERPVPNQRAVDLYEAALLSYRDAEKVWHANIFDSSDGGLLGRVLNPEYTGLQGIVHKYNLPTQSFLLSVHLPADAALQIIWQHAKARVKEANEVLERSLAERQNSPGSSSSAGNSTQTVALATVASQPLGSQANWVRSAEDGFAVRFVDTKSVRAEAFGISYRMRSQGKNNTLMNYERGAVVDCNGKQRFEVRSPNDQNALPFNPVYPGALNALELDYVCNLAAQSKVISGK